jgi:hypothetical protein
MIVLVCIYLIRLQNSSQGHAQDRDFPFVFHGCQQGEAQQGGDRLISGHDAATLSLPTSMIISHLRSRQLPPVRVAEAAQAGHFN